MHNGIRVAAFAAVALAFLARAPLSVAAESGADLFDDNCSMCHSIDPGVQKLGPSLAGILGRKSASLPDYPSYSPAMAGANLVWNKPTLDQYLKDPQAMLPGIKMTFPGLKNTKERTALIDYLATLKN